MRQLEVRRLCSQVMAFSIPSRIQAKPSRQYHTEPSLWQRASTSWQFELRQMEKRNRVLAEEMQSLMSNKKKRKRRKGLGQLQKDCVNCHTRSTPEWRRGPSGNRDLCNSCGLRWAKQVRTACWTEWELWSLTDFQNGRVSPRTISSHHSDMASASPADSSPANVADRNPVKSPARKSPGQCSSPEKQIKMEPASMNGFSGNRPEKIDEVAEPPD